MPNRTQQEAEEILPKIDPSRFTEENFATIMKTDDTPARNAILTLSDDCEVIGWCLSHKINVPCTWRYAVMLKHPNGLEAWMEATTISLQHLAFIQKLKASH
jgi:hypothetical protein